MSEFVVFETGDNRVLSAGDACARSQMSRHAIRRGQIIRFEVGYGRQIRRNVLAHFFEVRLLKGFNARGDGLVGEDDDRNAVFARDVDRLNRDVKAVFDIGRRQDNARRIAVAAEAGNVQV